MLKWTLIFSIQFTDQILYWNWFQIILIKYYWINCVSNNLTK